MRKIILSKVGIHFGTDAGYVNAHWVDLFGVGLCKSIRYRHIKSMVRFWKYIGQGVRFLIIGKF